MTVANDTLATQVVLEIGVRRQEAGNLHLDRLCQETAGIRSQDRGQGIIRKCLWTARLNNSILAHSVLFTSKLSDSSTPRYAVFNSARHQFSGIAHHDAVRPF